ncbi:hypothetical protein FJ208_02295, partial [Candidatus Gribaldobacteria bacterium]|nr:hypothetical protein [Candidatus Gribaldobacteria bacterium]
LSLLIIKPEQGKGFFQSEVEFKTASLEDYQGMSAKEKENIAKAKRLVLHPPLSIAFKVYSPGVYLYSLDSEELYLNQSVPDLRDYNFNQKAHYIRIQNVKRLLSGAVPLTNLVAKYFAVLFSEPEYQGSSKVFFPQISSDSGTGITVAHFSADGQPLTTQCDNQGKCQTINQLLKTYDPLNKVANFLVLPQEKEYLVNNQAKKITAPELYQQIFALIKQKELNPIGNIINNTALDIFPNKKSQSPAYEPSAERYGELATVSSVRVFQYNPDKSTCLKVILCTQEGGLKNPDSQCLLYLDPNSPEFKNQALVKNQVKYPMPLYEPINLPKTYVYTGPNQNNDYLFTLVDFNEEVRSIEIEGKCLVGLFSNKLKFDNQGNFKEWQNETTGMSGFFTQTNLTLTQNNQMGKCAKALGLQKNQPCASAIVIYPIEGESSVIAAQPGQNQLPGGFVYAGGNENWKNCFMGSEFNYQLKYTSSALIGFLNCLSGYYDAKPGSSCNWKVNSLSVHSPATPDSCRSNRIDKCIHSVGCSSDCYSCHFGGQFCQNSYAVDIDDIFNNQASFEQAIEKCLTEQSIAKFAWFYNETTHYHLSIGEAFGCGCDMVCASIC